MESLKIGVLYDAEVTCVGLQGAKAEMISPREGYSLSLSWNKDPTSVMDQWPFAFLASAVIHLSQRSDPYSLENNTFCRNSDPTMLSACLPSTP